MAAESPYLGQGCASPYSRGEVARREIWGLVEATLFRWSPRPWHGFRARLLRGFGADIPEPSRVVIFPTARVVFPWKLSLAPRAMVGPHVRLYNLAPIALRRGATVSQHCHLCSGSHDFLRWSMPLAARPIVLGENAWLGADVFVGPGVTIGELCVVGARSVVVRDLPPRKVCVGNPCRPVRDRLPPDDRAMKLCQIVPSLEERHGGPSKSVLNLSNALAEAGHEVNLLATVAGPGASTRQGRLEIDTYRRDWPQRVAPSRGLRARLRRIDAAVIHHHALWLRTLHYAHRAAARKGAILVVSPRGMMSTWAWRHHRWRKRLAQILIHPGAVAAVRGWHATSEEEAAEIRALGYAQPICIAPNGVSIPSSEQMERAAQHWHEACPEAAERPVALFYSRFHLKKRVIELIDVWLEHGPRDWLLLLVGIPQDYTPGMLEDYALRAGGPGRIRAFTGANRPPPYAAASLFLLPSHNENFGLAVAEALAHGVPALVTDTTPWRALNAVGGGWCVPWSQYPEALRAAVAEDPEKLRSRGALARAWVAREYSWEKPARALTDFYEGLAGS